MRGRGCARTVRCVRHTPHIGEDYGQGHHFLSKGLPRPLFCTALKSAEHVSWSEAVQGTLRGTSLQLCRWNFIVDRGLSSTFKNMYNKCYCNPIWKHFLLKQCNYVWPVSLSKTLWLLLCLFYSILFYTKLFSSSTVGTETNRHKLSSLKQHKCVSYKSRTPRRGRRTAFLLAAKARAAVSVSFLPPGLPTRPRPRASHPVILSPFLIFFAKRSQVSYKFGAGHITFEPADLQRPAR